MSKATSDDSQDEPVRYTVILTRAAHAKLLKVTKDHSLTQAEVIETLVTQHDAGQWAPVFADIRTAKLNARTSKRAIMQRLSKMSPEELAKVAQLALSQPQT